MSYDEINILKKTMAQKGAPKWNLVSEFLQTYYPDSAIYAYEENHIGDVKVELAEVVANNRFRQTGVLRVSSKEDGGVRAVYSSESGKLFNISTIFNDFVIAKNKDSNEQAEEQIL